MMFDFLENPKQKPQVKAVPNEGGKVKQQELTQGDIVIKVIGVGGGGGNAVNRMIESQLGGVDYVAINTDLQDLNKSKAKARLIIGDHCARGLGAGGKSEKGRMAAEESLESIRKYTQKADMVFVTAGMGGGTGTGGAPLVARAAKEAKALTVAVVTLPFRFEGKQRRRNAEQGIEELRKHVDTLIIIPNDKLIENVSAKTSMLEAFRLADNVLKQGVQAIVELITKDGMINLDFADVRSIIENQGTAVMGIGSASGEGRALKAVKNALHSPLLAHCNVTGAKGLLINIAGNEEMTLYEVQNAVQFLEKQAHEDAEIIWGSSINPELKGEIIVTLIATGFEAVASEVMVKTVEPQPKAVEFQAPPVEMSQPQFKVEAQPKETVGLRSSSPGIAETPHLSKTQTPHVEAQPKVTVGLRSLSPGIAETPHLSKTQTPSPATKFEKEPSAEERQPALPESASHFRYSAEEKQPGLPESASHFRQNSFNSMPSNVTSRRGSQPATNTQQRRSFNENTFAHSTQALSGEGRNSWRNSDQKQNEEDRMPLEQETTADAPPDFSEWALVQQQKQPGFWNDLNIPAFIRRRYKNAGGEVKV
ncbi:cell division protein FtsZ [Deltaproteobacteria bacterium TL4]